MDSKKIFLLAVLFLFLYTWYTGDIFGREYKNATGDKEYHIRKSLEPLGCCNNEYYAPLFHIIIYCIAQLTGTYNALNIFVPALMFLIMPYTFNQAYNSLWNEKKDTTTYYLLVPFFPILMLIINTWPQTLNMAFMLILLTLIFKQANMLLIFAVSILGLFSHTAGGFWIIAITLLYFYIKKRRLSLILLGIVVLMAIVYPDIYTRPLGVVLNFPRMIDLSLDRILEVIILWLNPLNIYMIYYGIKERRYYGINDVILMFSITTAFALAILDSELRSILNGMLLLGLYGYKGVEQHPKISKFMAVYGILWWITLVAGIVLMNI